MSPQLLDPIAGLVAACRPRISVVRTLAGALCLLAWSAAAHGAWFDSSWHFRVPITIASTVAINSTVRADVDFAALIASAGGTGTFDVNSPRVVRPNDALAARQEFTDAVFGGATDGVGNSRGEVRFLLEDAGPVTYYLYFDVTASGSKAANPQTPINGNFERGATGTSSPTGWTATRTSGFDAEVRPSESPSVTTDAGSPATVATDGTPNSGAFSYLLGARSNPEPNNFSGTAATLSRSIAVPSSSPGNLVIRYRPEGWDSSDNGATSFDYLRITVNGTEIVGPTYQNYRSLPFSSNKGTAQYSGGSWFPSSGYGRYNYWDIDGNGTHRDGMTFSGGSQPWITRTYSLSALAGQTVELRFSSYHTFQYKTWFHIDDVEWSVVDGAVGPPETNVEPGGFNAYESSTASGAVTGVIKTKIAGVPFNLDVVALNTAKTAIHTSFVGPVKVELLNASNNSGALDANGCRSSWTAIQTLSAPPTFVAADLGRKTVSFLEANAWPNVRVRMTYPSSGSARAIGCSTDNFAIRPAAFTSPVVTDSNWQASGTTRTLNNTASSGGVVHKAGQPFTVRASAANGASPAAVTSNYGGTPTAIVTTCGLAGCGAVAGTVSLGTAAVAGALTVSTATYSEAGAFSFQLSDQTFAAVDAADSTTAERFFVSPLVSVGRFVPDHFDITSAAVPVLKTFNDATCATRSFTYIGQPFGYVTRPSATITARNASGAVTRSYRGGLWKLSASSLSQTYSPLSPTSPGLSNAAIDTPALVSNGDGTGTYTANSADLLTFVRNTTTTQSEFTANISLTVNASDATEAAVTGNGTITATAPLVFNGSGSGIAFDSGALFRYGRLRLANAYGSERLALPVGLETQYWNGFGFTTNAADYCTRVAASNLKLSGYQPAGFSAAVPQSNVSIGGSVAAGKASLSLLKPLVVSRGSVDLCVDLDAGTGGDTTCQAAAPAGLAYLQDRRTGSTYTQDPTARAAFGLYKGPNNFIYYRENY